MSQTITISNAAYKRLQAEAHRRGLDSVEALIEAWDVDDAELQRRREVVEEIKALQQEIYEKYGVQSDSVDLIREDRDR